MRILFFIDTLLSGGKERQLVELIKGLCSYENINCEVVIMDKEVFYEEIFNLDLRVHFVIRRFPKDPIVVRDLYKICYSLRPDIIHVWGFPMVLYAWPIAKLLGSKILNGAVRFAGVAKPFSELWWYLKLTVPISDAVVANSMAGLKLFRNSHSRKYTCIYNGCNLEKDSWEVSSEEVRTRLNLATSWVIGMVANFNERKDYETPIKAVLKLLRKGKDVVFIAVGDGSGMQEVKSLIGDKYRRKFFFVGRQKNIKQYVKIFDIGLLTTNTKVHAEGMANSIMEYMAMGKPVIATDTGGNRELIADGTTGYLVPSFSADDIAETIEKLLNDKELRLRMGRHGKRRIIEEFSTEKMIGEYYKLYHSLKEY
jgi:glycosyltransferase involved in cell wall biosynthesis